jgi:hypothetical protein
MYDTDGIDLPGIGINGFYIDIFALTEDGAKQVANKEHPDMNITSVECLTL